MNTFKQEININLGDFVYVTEKGVTHQVISNKASYLDKFIVCSVYRSEGFYDLVSINGNVVWGVCDEDFVEGMLATYPMLSPTDKLNLWAEDGTEVDDTTIPFDEECECHIKSGVSDPYKDYIEKMEQEFRYKFPSSQEEWIKEEDEYTGGSVNYYKLHIKNPTTEGFAPYTCECNDIIEALGMNYAEGNAFKALWRRAAARKGIKKKGYDGGGLYDAEKVKFFGERLIVQSLEEDNT